MIATEPIKSRTRFASTRASALRRLRKFARTADRYARSRNMVVPGHTNVSRLSPALRHRLLTEDECCEAVLEHHPAARVEKFLQEVYWRRYWIGWLSLRPQVWKAYLTELRQLQYQPQFEGVRARARNCEDAGSDVEVMNHFANELVATGYLHNHARMWFAGWWVHVERLPWQLGADFFSRHLLDADPASNTLSWRWVAGLHTPGKVYLPRRSNIERYLDPEILRSATGGLEKLERPQPAGVGVVARERITVAGPRSSPVPAIDADSVGVWLHGDELVPELSPLSRAKPRALLIGDGVSSDGGRSPNQNRKRWLYRALRDAGRRAGDYFGCPPEFEPEGLAAGRIASWAEREQLRQVVALRPAVGPLSDIIPVVRAALQRSRVKLVLIDRADDVALHPLATGGFFNFWKRCQRLGRPASTLTTADR